MKLIITESKRNNIIFKWLNNNYGDLVPHNVGDFIIFKQDDNVVFDIDKDTGSVVVSHALWSFLEKMFDVSNDDIGKLIEKWISEYYNLNVTYAQCFGDGITPARWT